MRRRSVQLARFKLPAVVWVVAALVGLVSTLPQIHAFAHRDEARGVAHATKLQEARAARSGSDHQPADDDSCDECGLIALVSSIGIGAIAPSTLPPVNLGIYSPAPAVPGELHRSQLRLERGRGPPARA